MNRQNIRSERAHYMCPNMHFGIRFSLHSVFEPQKIREILELLAAAHPFLRALVQREDGTDNLFYNVTDESKIQCSSLADETKVEQAWGCIAISEWNVFVEGLLKVFSCPTQEGTTVLFAAHHLLTDGRGLLELVCEFTDCLADGKTPKFAEEHLIASMDDLPKESELAFVSRVLVDRAGKRWRKENHPVSYAQYLKFSVFFGETHPVDYRFDKMDESSLTALSGQCHAAGISINDWLMAQLYLRTGTKRIIIAADIRDRLREYRSGALGNYSTAMGIICRTRTTEPMEKAKDVHMLVRKALSNQKSKMLVLACYLQMEPTLLDAAAISALDGFDSKAARFVGSKMFGFSKPTAYSITNLGKFENQHMDFAEFIPPASPAASATIGVLTLNGVMRTVTSVYCEKKD